MIRALRYCIEEASASLWRGRRSGLLSVATNAAAMFVLGMLLLVTGNVEQVLTRWAAAAEMSVYLSDDVSVDDRTVIDELLAGSNLVREHEYLSKMQALERFRRDFAELIGVADELTDNPLPASFEVRLQPRPEQGREIDALAERLRQAVGVVDVRYDRQWIERIGATVMLTRGLGAIVVVILIVAAALTVANVVRLAGHARRDELEIMRLVGAPLAYVRGPFVVEGMLQGGVGAAFALALLWGGFALGRAQYGPMVADVLGVSVVGFLSLQSCVLLILGGVVVGSIGGLLGVRGPGGSGRTSAPDAAAHR